MIDKCYLRNFVIAAAICILVFFVFVYDHEETRMVKKLKIKSNILTNEINYWSERYQIHSEVGESEVTIIKKDHQKLKDTIVGYDKFVMQNEKSKWSKKLLCKINVLREILKKMKKLIEYKCAYINSISRSTGNLGCPEFSVPIKRGM